MKGICRGIRSGDEKLCFVTNGVLFISGKAFDKKRRIFLWEEKVYLYIRFSPTGKVYKIKYKIKCKIKCITSYSRVCGLGR